MDDLLREAIADAKAVRETALANAKIALEEAFTPRLQSMLSKKIASEMEDKDEEEAERQRPKDKQKKLVQLLLLGVGDNIPSLRKNVAFALATACRVWDLYEEVFSVLDAHLRGCENQPMDSSSFSQYTPSGPFSSCIAARWA